MKSLLVIAAVPFLSVASPALATDADRGPLPVYSVDEIAWSRSEGSNQIEGSGRQMRNGVAKTCAGEKIFLRPRSTVEDRRNLVIFGSDRRARITALRYMEVAGTENPDMPVIPKTYDDDARRATCSPDGRFSFSGLPDGEYYASVMVFPEEYRGKVTPIETIDVLLQRVSVEGGRTTVLDLFSEL
jgi:hypothetical protein